MPKDHFFMMGDNRDDRSTAASRSPTAAWATGSGREPRRQSADRRRLVRLSRRCFARRHRGQDPRLARPHVDRLIRPARAEARGLWQLRGLRRFALLLVGHDAIDDLPDLAPVEPAVEIIAAGSGQKKVRATKSSISLAQRSAGYFALLWSRIAICGSTAAWISASIAARDPNGALPNNSEATSANASRKLRAGSSPGP